MSDSVREPACVFMKTAVIKRSIFINGRKTSVSLENEFWAGLHDIAKSRKTTAVKLVEEINRQRSTVNLSSAIRIYVYNYFRSIAGEQGEANPAQNHLDSRSLRARADKYRALAEGLKDTETRTSMLSIADDYQQMAASVDRLERPAEAD